MLAAKYIAFFMFVWVGGAILGAILEKAFVGEGQRSVLDDLTFWQKIQSEESWGFWEIPGAVPGFFTALFRMMTLNFNFVQGTDFELYRWFIVLPLVGLFVYGLVMTVIGIFTKDL